MGLHKIMTMKIKIKTINYYKPKILWMKMSNLKINLITKIITQTIAMKLCKHLTPLNNHLLYLKGILILKTIIINYWKWTQVPVLQKKEKYTFKFKIKSKKRKNNKKKINEKMNMIFKIEKLFIYKMMFK